MLALGWGLAMHAWSWFTVVGITVLGLLMILWNRRVFRPDVIRNGPQELRIGFAPKRNGARDGTPR